MEQKIGYKVLKRNRRSIIQDLYEGGLHYPKLTEVKPNKDCGPLCVFIFYKFALEFSEECRMASIVTECRYTESTIEYIWFNEYFNRHIFNLPDGTVLADSVTCLE